MCIYVHVSTHIYTDEVSNNANLMIRRISIPDTQYILIETNA